MALASSGFLYGQAAATSSASNPISQEVASSYERVKGYVLTAADKMPAADYPFKPTADIRTFARVVNHITEAQSRACGTFNGDKVADSPAPPETAEKDVIVAALKTSFAECDKAYAASTDAKMTEMVQVGASKRSRIGLLWGNVSHDNEQYATLATYMRLKGQVPPSSEK